MTGEWYAVHTGPRAEWLARDRLQQRGYRTFLPHFLAEASHARRVVQVRRPLFGRYLFAFVRPEQGIYAINTAPGVACVVYTGAGALRVSGEQMESLMQRADSEGLIEFVVPEAPERLAEGDRVVVVSGPFEGVHGTVLRVTALREPRGVDQISQIGIMLETQAGRIKATLPADMVAKRLSP
jgi:transcription antitermination factor NusG